jgi:hypothetical protein
MFQRGISRDDVLSILQEGQVIEDYPDDTPYPSRLLLGRASGRWLHVVVARDIESSSCIVVTTYEPKPVLWSMDFGTRRLV